MSESTIEGQLQEARNLLKRFLEIEEHHGVFDRYADEDVWHSQSLSDLITDIEKFLEDKG